MRYNKNMKDTINGRVVIIVLNYMNYEETDKCTQLLLEQNYNDYYIVIVDNGSENDSYKYLKHQYVNEKKVFVIKTGKNYGFSKGNNIGINYAKKIHAEYIMLLNSDTRVEDPNYIKKMVSCNAEKVGVIGSRIIESGNSKVRKINRYVTFPDTLYYYFARRSEYRESIFLQSYWEHKLKKSKGAGIIQGCVLLLTPAYFQYYDGLDPRTFLYCEEELLYLRCKKAGLQEKLNDEAVLYHKVGQSTKMMCGNQRKSFLKYMLKSYKYVLWESIKNYLVEFGKV